jgi:hypothetical protein
VSSPNSACKKKLYKCRPGAATPVDTHSSRRQRRLRPCDAATLENGVRQALADRISGNLVGLLPRIRCLVGEWHVLPEHGQTPASVMHNLRSILAATHQVEIGRRAGVGLGYFRAMLK